jgi:hypothetical protein
MEGYEGLVGVGAMLELILVMGVARLLSSRDVNGISFARNQIPFV